MFPGRRYGRRRHYGRGGGGLGQLLLGMQVLSFFNFLSRSDRFFPATLGVLAFNIVAHLRPRGIKVGWPSIQQACISVKGVLFDRQWKRLFTSPFVHASDYHLYYNMASFMWKAVTLERHFGSAYFAYMVGVFSMATGVVYLAIHYLLAEFLDQWSHMQSCAVGFSGVIFALKVVTTHLQPNGMTMIMGVIPVPARLACWAELVLISVLFPNVSFVGHLAGILVGMAFVSGPLKSVMDMPLTLLDATPRYVPHDGGDGGGGGSYTYRAAPTGFRAGSDRGDGGAGGGSGSDRGTTGVRQAQEEEEELQEAIRMSLQHHQQQRERTPMPSAPPSNGREDSDIQEAIDRSLRDTTTSHPPAENHTDAPPPPFNPAYPPPPGHGGGLEGGGVAPPERREPEQETVRRRHVGRVEGEADMRAIRAARLRRFERTN